jgi:hypothetical protein
MEDSKMTRNQNPKENRLENLRHEYDITTRHYFYEGELMLKRNQFFVALNLGIFTIMGFVGRDENGFGMLLPVTLPSLCLLGALISKYWIVMTRRASCYILARVTRIKEIEDELGYKTMNGLLNMKADAEPPTRILFVRLGYTFMWAWTALFLLLLVLFATEFGFL